MNALHIFFNEFWLNFVIFWVIYALVTWGRRVSLGRNAVSIGPKSFRELSAFSMEEQLRLLHEADKEAFQGWRLIFPAFLFAANLAGAMAVGMTIPKITTLPGSLWVVLGFALPFILLGFWATGWVEARFIKPFLKRQIEKRNPDAGQAHSIA